VLNGEPKNLKFSHSGLISSEIPFTIAGKTIE
jgi:hypothetical protein